MNKELHLKSFLIFTFVMTMSLFHTQITQAQSTPAEFAEMSLQELFELKIDNESRPEQDMPKWNVSYQYKVAEFDGYLEGDESLSRQDVLWSGPDEVRTAANFPIVPTVIKQRAHLVRVGYQYSDTLALYLSAPYIKQETDHISIIPGYEHFIIETDGVGDTIFSLNYKFVDIDLHRWWVNFGISLPTGSIEEHGDTPRALGNQQLPYTMQTSSGTYDIPIEFNYQHLGAKDFSLTFSAMLRTGTNDRDYRLGNNYRISLKYGFPLMAQMKWFLGSEFQYSSKISGQDDTLLINAPFPYPASITNPNFYGGRKLSVRTGLTWQIDNRFRVTAELGKPVYQHLNGPQPKETWRGALQLSTAF